MDKLRWLSLIIGYIVMTCMSINILVDSINTADTIIDRIGAILLTCAWICMLAMGFMLLIHAKQQEDE